MTVNQVSQLLVSLVTLWHKLPSLAPPGEHHILYMYIVSRWNKSAMKWVCSECSESGSVQSAMKWVCSECSESGSVQSAMKWVCAECNESGSVQWHSQDAIDARTQHWHMTYVCTNFCAKCSSI